MMDPQDISTLGDVNSPQPGWLRSGYQDPLDDAISVAQPQKLHPVGVVIMKNDDTLMGRYHMVSGHPPLAEPSKGQGWFKPCAAAVPGSEVRVLVVGTMTEPGQRLNYETDWPKAAEFVSDQAMLADTLHELFHDANEEIFEDGMTSRFSDALRNIVREHGVEAIEHIGAAIRAVDTSVKVAEEALRQVGHINDRRTHSARRSLLECFLESSDIRMRDAASIGIEAMEDPAAVPALKRAIETEPAGWLQQYLKDVMNQLSKT